MKIFWNNFLIQLMFVGRNEHDDQNTPKSELHTNPIEDSGSDKSTTSENNEFITESTSLMSLLSEAHSRVLSLSEQRVNSSFHSHLN